MLAATISLVGHNCLFVARRLSLEFRSGDVKWNLDQRIVTLHISSTQEPGKVAQDGSGYDVHIGDYSGPSGYKYLKCWFDVHMLWAWKSLYIFPRGLKHIRIKTHTYKAHKFKAHIFGQLGNT